MSRRRLAAFSFFLFVLFGFVYIAQIFREDLKSFFVIDQDTEESYLEKAALHSFLDYTIFALERGWCFRKDWLWETSEKCTWDHSRNSLRLVLSKNDLYNIKKY
ncbi:MAG: hypothetical protein KDD61_15460, partial [Bdellovibrionales bacterium]|nr:hypothetical protein [Bdellovibrionales bacterium]